MEGPEERQHIVEKVWLDPLIMPAIGTMPKCRSGFVQDSFRFVC